MATRAKSKKPEQPDNRPFFTVSIKDPQAVHRAIADGSLPLNTAPINVSMLHVWAHEKCVRDCHVHGLELKVKT
jgi:hypothetical protein